MFVVLLVLLIVFVICCIEIFKEMILSDEANEFYKTIEIGDVFWYISGPDVFKEPTEIITILDKKSGCVKYKFEDTRKNIIKEESSTIINFYEIYCKYNLKKQEK